MSLKHNLFTINERIEMACSKAGRNAQEVTIVAVTKNVPVEKILEAYDCGIRTFGANYLQDYLNKSSDIPTDTAWHFIGRIQSNKVKKIAQEFDWVQSLDSLRTAESLNQATEQTLNALVEVNIAEEPQKGGVLPKDLDEFIEKVQHFTKLSVRGLMTMGPANQNPEELRPYFKSMRRMFEKHDFDCLSMGMSNDFEVAIQEGCTHVRIGTALFGERKTI